MAIYRTLLLLLPRWFREDFGGEMSAVFRQTRIDARRRGLVAVPALWMTTIRDVGALAMRLHLDALRQDTSYALRTLARTPTFALALVATLAIGMGPMLVIANLLERVVLRPLPFAAPDRLVAMWNGQPEANRREFPLSLPDFVDFHAGQRALEALAAHAGTSVAVVGSGEPRQAGGVLTTADLFQVLKVAPVLGRPLTAADSAPGAAPVLVIGDTFWQAEFGGRHDVIGQTLKIDGTPTEIVGVLPPLDYPNGSRGFWMPLTIDPAMASRGSHYLNATGRLAAGTSIEQASDALNGIARSLAEQYPSTNGGNGVELVPLKRQLNGDSPRVIAILAIAIAAVLLIACSNVASLLAVRASLRQPELAVRTAVGASIARLRRQLLVEHLLLALSGAALAVAIAIPMHRVLVEERVLALPRTATPTIGWPAIAALVILAVAIACILSRLAARRPAIDASASTLLTTARHTGGRSQLRIRQALVVVEVAGALALVVVAGLMLRSATKLMNVDPGFRTENVTTFGVVLPGSAYPDPAARLQFVERVLETLRRIPGVSAAASAGYAPMGQMRATRRFAPADRPLAAAGSELLALDTPVGVGYFEVMGIPLVEGRTFDERDTPTAPPTLIVSEAFAREVFPGRSAVGQRIGFYSARPGGTPPPSREIVGVVRDVRQDAVNRGPMAQMYSPYSQSAWSFTSFFLRVDGDAATPAAVQAAVSSVDPMRPVRDVTSTAELVRASTARDRAITWMLTALATIALLLAAIGLYGVSATTTAARSREFAIRAAVGAQPAALMGLVLRQGLTMGAVGVLLGGAATLGVTEGLKALLYETAPRDPATFAATAALLLAIASAATYVPARRALKANPADVLRAE